MRKTDFKIISLYVCKMKFLGIIPARYNSTRFPGKPLALIAGKPMIQWVYELSAKSSVLNQVIVATDSEEILKKVHSFGGRAQMTSNNHENGTSRCLEVFESQKENFDGFINIQGDEPFLEETHLSALVEILAQENAEIGTLACFQKNLKDYKNPNVVKLVKNLNNKALYFSRQAIPFYKNEYQGHWKHIGLYGFTKQVIPKLKQLKNLPHLAKSENLEQLQWLENALSISVQVVENESLGVDTPKDLVKANQLAKKLLSQKG